MTILLNTLVFLLAMCICVQLIAALYGIIDLWYTISTAYPAVIRRILTWTVIPIAIVWLLGEALRPAFLWGMVGFFIFYVLSFWGYQLLFLRNMRLLGIRRPLGTGLKGRRGKV